MDKQKEAARAAEDRRRRMAQWAAEYAAAVGPMEERIRQLKERLAAARGEESIRLERRIELLQYEIGDLRKIAAWIEGEG